MYIYAPVSKAVHVIFFFILVLFANPRWITRCPGSGGRPSFHSLSKPWLGVVCLGKSITVIYSVSILTILVGQQKTVNYKSINPDPRLRAMKIFALRQILKIQINKKADDKLSRRPLRFMYVIFVSVPPIACIIHVGPSAQSTWGDSRMERVTSGFASHIWISSPHPFLTYWGRGTFLWRLNHICIVLLDNFPVSVWRLHFTLWFIE